MPYDQEHGARRLNIHGPLAGQAMDCVGRIVPLIRALIDVPLARLVSRRLDVRFQQQSRANE